MIEPLLAGCCAALGVWIWRSRPGVGTRLPSSEGEGVEISLVVVLEMLAVALRQGASITHALRVIGDIVSGRFGLGLCLVATALEQGCSWQDAWISSSAKSRGDVHEDCVNPRGGRPRRDTAKNVAADGLESAEDDAFLIVEEVLKDSWTLGAPPANRLESTMEQIDASQKAAIDEAASRLSIDLLTPTALCFLPAFMLIGVVPCIGAFIR